jgi:hypothetical protein
MPSFPQHSYPKIKQRCDKSSLLTFLWLGLISMDWMSSFGPEAERRSLSSRRHQG